MLEIKAIATKTNTSGIALYDITDEQALVGLNNDNPEWVNIKQDGEPYIDFYGKTYISEFMKVWGVSKKGEE